MDSIILHCERLAMYINFLNKPIPSQDNSHMSNIMEQKSSSPNRKTQRNNLQYHLKTEILSATLASVTPVSSPSYRGDGVNYAFDLGLVIQDPANNFSGVLQLTKINEKEQMHGLNNRFASFIEKVRHLEHQNQLQEREIEDIRQKAQSPSVAQEFEEELSNLRNELQAITLQKCQVEMERENMEDDLQILKKKYDKEMFKRSDAENGYVALKRDADDANMTKLQLNKKALSLHDEITLLKKIHEVEVTETVSQIREAQVKVKSHDSGKPNLSAALIWARLENHAVSDIQQMDECFRDQFAKLTKATESNREALKATTLEIKVYRRHLQENNIELDCAKGTREGLDRQLRELEERHKKEMIHYQDAIKELENELINAKFDMSGHLRKYQGLLNVKMALDVEILSYRKLLEGEETRLSTMSGTYISMPYVYRQSPVYTLPCLSRQGGPTRRAEPQYKFVEEIITETTREVEMSLKTSPEFEGARGPEENIGGVARDHREEGGEIQTGSSEGKKGKDADKEEIPEEKIEKVMKVQNVEISLQDMEHANPETAGEGEENTYTPKQKNNTVPDVKRSREIGSEVIMSYGVKEKDDTEYPVSGEKDAHEDPLKKKKTQSQVLVSDDSPKDVLQENSKSSESRLPKETTEGNKTEDFTTKPPENKEKVTVSMGITLSVNDRTLGETKTSTKSDEN